MPLFPSPVDRAFLRFCRTGDPAALGRVFDRTAPELLRVACYLAGQRADAEDLVQRTFLAAIEARASFDPEARALPWLLGILSNHARRLQRERRRRAPEVEERTADPAEDTAQRELEERLARLRAELGEPYADVLRLHLEQGCNAKEIAARLSRPPGTVRTQLVRALAQLRERLPDGFVAGGVAALLSRPGASQAALAAMRAHIVHGAAASSASSASVASLVPVVVTGSWLMSKKVVGIAASVLALSGVGGYLAWPPTPAVPQTTASAQAGGAVASELPNATARREVDAARTADERTSAASAAAVPDPADAGFGVIRVRVRWQDDGSPAAGIGVFASNGRAVMRRDAVTGGDGCGDLPHLQPGAWAVGTSLGEGPSERCDVAGDGVRVLDLSVPRGAVAAGRVVDKDGRPVAAARIWMSIAGDWGHGHEVARSADDGTFAVPIAGHHYLGARKDGFAPSHTCVASPATRGPFVLRLDRLGGTVRGSVRDERGRPVAWAKVLVGDEFNRVLNSGTQPTGENRPRGMELTTDRDGRFVAVGVPAGLVDLRAWAPGFAPVETGLEVPAGGETESTVTLTAGASVHGTVRDPRGGVLTGASVRWGASYRFAERSAKSDERGAFVLDDLPAGSQELVAEHAGARVATRLELVPAQTHAWDPVVGDNRPIAGRVVGAQGEPLDGYTIEAWHEFDARGSATTDARGTFTLAEPGAEPVTLVVAHDGQKLLELPDVAPGRDDVVVTLDERHLASAFLTGRLVDERGQPVGAVLLPWHAESDRALHYHSDAKTGAFRVGPLRPGRYRLVVESPRFGRRQVREVDVAPRAVVDLGDIALQAAGAVEFAVRMLGRPAPGGLLILRQPDGSWSDTLVIEDGKAQHGALPAGKLHVTVDFNGFTDNREVTVVAGGTTRVDLELQSTHRATVVVRDPLGRSRDELDVRVQAARDDGTFAGLFAAVNLPGPPTCFVDLPPARYTLHLKAKDGRAARGEVDLRAGPVDATIELPK